MKISGLLEAVKVFVDHLTLFNLKNSHKDKPQTETFSVGLQKMDAVHSNIFGLCIYIFQCYICFWAPIENVSAPFYS